MCPSHVVSSGCKMPCTRSRCGPIHRALSTGPRGAARDPCMDSPGLNLILWLPMHISEATSYSQDWTRYCKRHRNLNGVTVGHAHGWAGPPVSVQVHRRHAPGSTGPNLVLGVQAGLPGTILGPVDRHGVTVHILIGCRASCTLITHHTAREKHNTPGEGCRQQLLCSEGQHLAPHYISDQCLVSASSAMKGCRVLGIAST